MDAKQKTENSLQKLTTCISAMQRELNKEKNLRHIRLYYARKYKVTVTLVTALIELGYIVRLKDKKAKWSLIPTDQKPENIAFMVREKNRLQALEWASKRKKTKQIEESKNPVVKNDYLEFSTGETLLRKLLELSKEKQIEIATIILKSYDYKILKQVIEYKEL